MEYKNAAAKTYVKDEDNEFKCGARLVGDDTCSAYEARFTVGEEPPEEGGALGATAQAHAFQFSSEEGGPKIKGRYLGADVGFRFNFKSEEKVNKDKQFLGGEVKARATLTDATIGPLQAHTGVGVSTALKIEDRTAEAKIAGCGFKVGKKIGISIFDNEISLDVGGLIDKILD